MNKIAVVMYGPPGSGKGTQAHLLADRLDLMHFDTGRFLESIVHDPKRLKSKIIRKERRLFDSGKLMTPSFVLREMKRGVKTIAKTGHGIVFSGSPRTKGEAEKLLPILERLYARKYIFVFKLKIREFIGIRRNVNRIVCAVCKAPLLTAYYPSKKPKHCPVCAGPFYKRTLDNQETLKVRLKEYHHRTEPILKMMKKRGYKIREVNAEPAPHKVFRQIFNSLKKYEAA